MHVRKRNGDLQPVDLNKIVASLKRYCDFPNVDVYRIATKTVGGLVDGVSTLELDMLSVRTAKDLIIEDPIYSRVAARILANIIQKEVSGQDIQSFSQSIEVGFKQGLIAEQTYNLVMLNKRKLNAAIKHERDWSFEYHGIQTVYDRYLLKHRTRTATEEGGKKQRAVIETPQYFFMRVACGLSNDANEAVELYNLLSSLEYMCSTPTLFNSGTVHSQMSSCFVAGTQVFTLAGVKNIEDVRIGDRLTTHTGATHEVTQIHKNPLAGRTLFDLKCQGTPLFTVTDNHGFWSLSREQIEWGQTKPTWNRADYLREGDWIAIPNVRDGVKNDNIDVGDFVELFQSNGGNTIYDYEVSYDAINVRSVWTRADHLNGNPLGIRMTKDHNPIKRNWKLDNDFAQFLGIWYGDGHINKHRDSNSNQIIDGIGITAHKNNVSLIEFVKKVAQDSMGVVVKEYPHLDQNCTKLLIHSPLIGNVFNHLFGAYCDGKKLYTGAFKWSRDLFESFLIGLISTDGCVSSHGAVTVSLANPDLLKAIYMVGRNLGLPITYRKGQNKDGCLPQAAINIPITTEMLTRIHKTYDDDRLAILKPSLSTKIKIIDGITYVRINKKNVSARRDDFVYTLGVENDHSYSVEGVLCENCYLLDSPIDSLDDIYKRYADIALLSKFAGGIGVSMSRLRGKGSLIRGTNGNSNGVVPWEHTLSASVAAVNQGGKRKGAACVYMETHHPDIMEFLETRDNTGGNNEKRAYNLNLANWVSDLFMRRVKEDSMWSLFDPAVAPELADLYGDAYETRYLQLEAEGKYVEQLPARKLYARMMRTLAETGNGWMCFKDICNRRGNQVNDEAGTIIHLSNLCTEILEVTSSGKRRNMTREEMMSTTAVEMIEKNIHVVGYDIDKDAFEVIEGMETAVCNLGSINIGRGYIKHGKLDKDKLRKNVAIAIKFLDRVVDRNFYPIPEARASNMRWRPIGIGLMGLADFFFQLRMPFDSEEAIKLSAEIQEEIYFQALKTSCELAKQFGPHRDFNLTRAAKGQLQFDLAGATPTDTARWNTLRQDIMEHGLRNSLLIAIAPTATISHICGVEECIEPIKSNLLKRETLSGEFIAINKYLVDDLRKIDRWNAETISKLKQDEGSIANIAGLPADLYAIYKTVWEMSMKSLIAHGAARGAYIDQSHSLNMFIDLNKYPEDKRIGVLSSLYMHAWESGLKTTYYFRSRAASRIEQTTTRPTRKSDEAVMAAENPEVCESCT